MFYILFQTINVHCIINPYKQTSINACVNCILGILLIPINLDPYLCLFTFFARVPSL
ncbi:Orf2 [Heliothis zea nudivirus]|uniref:Orf2 n=1 Tax=Heliothis zea nudivirus 1 TaxID=3116536 RepID=Q8JKV8_9VIRU|nr:Orf2 [Heliothis zea nudivirus]AAN04300.1 Orf2 [Heliothis zea nudivirus]